MGSRTSSGSGGSSIRTRVPPITGPSRVTTTTRGCDNWNRASGLQGAAQPFWAPAHQIYVSKVVQPVVDQPQVERRPTGIITIVFNALWEKWPVRHGQN